MNSIDIDVGGTFTDLVLNFDGKALIKKTPTTPYDLSVCFSRVIEEGAGALGLKIDQLLPAIDMIRYSTTIAMNRLTRRRPPVLSFLGRRHPVNRQLGLLRHRAMRMFGREE